MKRIVCLCSAVFVFFSLTAVAEEIDFSQEKVLYNVACSHLDTQWRWTIQDTIYDFLVRTCDQNFPLLEKYPNYKLSFEGSFRYMLIKEYYPNKYERIKEFVKKGQWCVAGSAVDGGDTNTVSGESLIRNYLYGNRFFEQEFGKRSVDIFLPDCFGFSYALPTIANHCGIKGFSTQKLLWGSSVGVPFDIGRWEGPDGSEIIAAINPGSYTTAVETNLSSDEKQIETVEAFGKETGLYVGFKYFGTGDTGGAPPESSVAMMEKSVTSDGPLKVINTSSDQLFRDLTSGQIQQLPHYKGHFLLSVHGVGCYTAQGAMKRFNRKNELLADATERVSVMADTLGGADYPVEKLREAWIRFLWHQFHDDLTGTSIPKAYHFSWNDELISMNQFSEALCHAAASMTRAMDTQCVGIPLVVYNPLAFKREDVVEATVSYTEKVPDKIRVYNYRGNEVPSQIVRRLGNTLTILFLAEVPSVGLSVFDVREAKRGCQMNTGLKISEKRLENKRYRVSIDDNGDISAIYDKTLRRQLLAEPVRLQMLYHKPDAWPAWEIAYKDITAKPVGYLNAPAEIRIKENGPARITLEILRHYNQSTFIQHVSLSANDAADIVEIETYIDWQEMATLCKTAFVLAASNSNATYDIDIGTIQYGNNHEKLFEVPAQQWVDLTDAKGRFGIALLSDCKYGWDKPNDNTLRLTLLHTPDPRTSFPDQAWLDHGQHRMKMAVYGHSKDWRNGVVSRGARFNQAMSAFQTDSHKGMLGRTYSFLQVNNPAIAVKALKKAEDSDEIIIRLQETSGKPVKKVKVQFADRIIKLREVNGSEKHIQDLKPVSGNLVVDMNGYQPRAFAITLKKSDTKLTPPPSKPIKLTYNKDVVSLDSDMKDGDFNGHGHTLPGELLPNSLVCEDIPFKLGSSKAGHNNALVCRGQTINVHTKGHNSLYILASAVGNTQGTFVIDGKAQTIGVQDFTGFVGQWERNNAYQSVPTKLKVESAYYHDDAIAWVGTHRHYPPRGNEPYDFCYIYKYRLDLPKAQDAAIQVKLPDNEKIHIFSMTLADKLDTHFGPASVIGDEMMQSVSIMPNGTIFVDTITITIQENRENAVIHYTLDGTEPDKDSPVYIGPITLTRSTTLKAKSIVNGVPDILSRAAVFTKVTPRQPVTIDNMKQGLRFRYYEGEWHKIPDYDSMEPLKTGVVDYFNVEGDVEDYYGYRFSGYLEVPKDAVYTFFIRSDDGSNLYIGDQRVAVNDGRHGPDEEIAGSIALKAGKHPITVNYFEANGGQSIEVSYEAADIEKQKIPKDRLYYLEQ